MSFIPAENEHLHETGETAPQPEPLSAQGIGAMRGEAAQPAEPRSPGMVEAQPGGEADANAPVLDSLRERDQEVRAHEQDHLQAAGRLAQGVHYDTVTGPDGQAYAVGGNVDVRMPSPDASPEQRAQDARQIKAAAAAPEAMSEQDQAVYAQADQAEKTALAEANRGEQRYEGGRLSRSGLRAVQGGDFGKEAGPANASAALESPQDHQLSTPEEGENLYTRPAFRKGMRDEVWNRAIGSDGQVRDPGTQEVMNKDEPWDMGHKPGYEFRKHQASAMERGISREQFIQEYNNPDQFRPELPKSNRSHQFEDQTDRYFGE